MSYVTLYLQCGSSVMQVNLCLVSSVNALRKLVFPDWRLKKQYTQQGEAFRKPETKGCTPYLSSSPGLELLEGNRS